MSGATSIQWTDATWNPTRGCSRISPGCENCYAERIAGRFGIPGGAFFGFARDGKWTRKVELIPDMLDLPLHWKKPRRIFVNSMSDLFHEKLGWLEIGRVFDVMERCPQHTFQVLTKRADRLREFMQTEYATEPPPRNVWLGVSVEDQQRADERIPVLLEAPAAVRFLSCEPLLSSVNLSPYLNRCQRIHWVIAGGESGPEARPCALEWIENIVADCGFTGTAAFVKQLGAIPVSMARTAPPDMTTYPGRLGPEHYAPNGEVWAWTAGRNGKWDDIDEFPSNLQVRQFPPEAAP